MAATLKFSNLYPKPVRFNRRQVALMVQIAMLYRIDSIMMTTGHSPAQLRAMAAGKIRPSRAVRDYFRLKARGSAYLWDPKLEFKSNPCWGPVLQRSTREDVENSQAIYFALRTVGSSFANAID